MRTFSKNVGRSLCLTAGLTLERQLMRGLSRDWSTTSIDAGTQLRSEGRVIDVQEVSTRKGGGPSVGSCKPIDPPETSMRDRRVG